MKKGFLTVAMLAVLLTACEPSSLIAYTNQISCSFDTISWQILKQDNDMMELMVQIFNLDCE